MTLGGRRREAPYEWARDFGEPGNRLYVNRTCTPAVRTVGSNGSCSDDYRNRRIDASELVADLPTRRRSEMQNDRVRCERLARTTDLRLTESSVVPGTITASSISIVVRAVAYLRRRG